IRLLSLTQCERGRYEIMAETLRDEVEGREYVWRGVTGHVGADVEVRDIGEVIRDRVFELIKTRLNAHPDQLQEIILGTDMTGADGSEFAKAIIPLRSEERRV